jgi:hypothetical protein
MIMLDRWEEMAMDARYDKPTLAACQILASEMCASIFERMSLDVQSVEGSLRVSGRGLTYLFPIRERTVKVRPDVPEGTGPVTEAGPPARSRRPARTGRG